MKTFTLFLVLCVIALVIYAIATGLPADVISPFHVPNP